MRRLVVLCALIGCGDNTVVDKTAACDLGTATSAATIQDRKIIGVAAPYVPDLGLAAREDELRTSIAARRAVAWQVVERVLHPVPLGEPALAARFGGEPSIPAWHTWYAHDDFDRVFDKLYEDLGPAARKLRAPLDDATIDAGFAWNAVALDGLTDWPEQRYLDYLAAIQTQPEVDGVGDANRVSYSPGAMRHLIGSYAKQDTCRLAATPDPFDGDPMRPGKSITQTEAVALDGCGWRVLGPYVAAAGSTVTVTMRGDGDADLYVRQGAAPDPQSFDCRSAGGTSDEGCAIAGDGPVYVAVFGARPSTVQLAIDYTTADVIDPTCLDGEMPRDAVLVKADWRRVLPGALLPSFDTSAATLAAQLAGAATWTPGAALDPGAASIYTVTLSNGDTFRMPALHVMSKELDHWLWITLWWSPDPTRDFGADRPAEIATLPGPWANYKMCVSSSYLEGDDDPRGGFADGLGDALAAVSGGPGAPSWCSNPYLELGTGNGATNCIGCHQHGGTALLPAEILESQPHHGTTRVRNNFFTDYLWAIKGGGGEELSADVQAELDYWDANDP